MASSSTRAAGSPVELEFGIRDPECFFVGVSAEESCHVSLEHLVRRSDGRLLEFFAVTGAAPDRVLARATGLVTGDGDRLFADRDGEAVTPERFEAVRRESRVAAANVTGQGAICSALHEARNGVPAED